MARITNNTVLSNFALVGRLDILQRVFGKVLVTHEVRQEVLRGIEEGYDFLEPVEEAIGVGEPAWLELIGFETSQEEQSFRIFATHLGFGEASCVAIAKHRAWLVLTDDRAARTTLGRERIQFTGTLGILKLAVEGRILTLAEANSLLKRMIEAGYYSPYRDLSEI